MLKLFNARPCFSTDLTIMHLQRKLNRLDSRIQKTTATQADYINRERVAFQLADARAYLC